MVGFSSATPARPAHLPGARLSACLTTTPAPLRATWQKASRRWRLQPKTARAVRLLFTTIAYLIFGAMVFSALELETDELERVRIADALEEMQAKYNFTQVDFADLEQVAITSIPFAAGFQWQFAGAFYFATVVITTIGYGHATPQTLGGKLFCMVFALGGIPLSFIMFQSVGERVNTFINAQLVHLQAAINVKMFDEVTSKHLIFVSLTIGSITIVLGVFVFHRCEGWSLFNSLYYIVITLSTIGFGDFVPLQTQGRLQNDVGYVIFTLAFIQCGLAVFSACINLLILEFMAHNADIVTARSRIRRLFSLRGNGSIRATMRRRRAGQTAAAPQLITGNTRYATRLSRHNRLSRHSDFLLEPLQPLPATRIIHPRARRKSSHSPAAKNSTARPQPFPITRDKSFFAKAYRHYFQIRKNDFTDRFTVRRHPTPYIEHLVDCNDTYL